jgi:tetratricopeptide (TPR) repeat protein
LTSSIVITGVFMTLQNKEFVSFQSADAGRPPLDAERLSGINHRAATRKNINIGQILSWLLGLSTVLLLSLPLRSELKVAIIFSLIGLAAILLSKLSSLQRQVLGLTQQGEYDKAMQRIKPFLWIPGFGAPLQGMILFGAGRYAEALALMKPLAFDANGQPRLTSIALYTYALALGNSDRNAEAQELLEAAVRVPQTSGVFHVALATCLLTQDKDPERARELIEQAMMNWPTKTDRYESRADQMRRLSRYAWALAACGRKQEAEAKLQEAFAGARDFRSGDLAGVQYFAGEAWRAMGETAKARAAFKETMTLSPTGAAWTSATKALSRMDVA